MRWSRDVNQTQRLSRSLELMVFNPPVVRRNARYLAIRREMVKNLQHNARVPLALGAFAFLATALLLVEQVPSGRLAMWFGVGLSVLAARFCLHSFQEKLFSRIRDRVLACCIGIAMTGITWGALSTFWRPDLPLYAQMVIVLFPVALSISSAVAYANWLPAFLAFAIPAQVPMAALMITSPQTGVPLLAIPTVILLCGQLLLVRQINKQLRRCVELQFGNDALVEHLSARNNELLRAHEAVNASSRAKTEFLARMSHELRTPLNGVMGMTGSLLRTQLDPGQRMSLDVLAVAAADMRKLVDELLDATLLHSQAVELETSDVQVAHIVTSIETALTPLANAKGVALNTTVDAGVPEYLHADADRLRQLVFSIVDNAVKFTESGRIDVRVAASRGEAPRLQFLVEDTGIGMPVDLQEAVFELFTQAEGNSGRSRGGVGLGLGVAKQLAELMDGHIELHSTPGVGTRVIVDLPLQAAQSSPQHDEGSTQPDTCSGDDVSHVQPLASRTPSGALPVRAVDVADGATVDVLVAEDNRTNRLVIESLLDDDRLAVRFAEDGVEALAAVEESQPDLVLMDCHMPQMDGFDATKELRARGYCMPIIAVTADALPGAREHCMSVGMNDYVAKPVEQELLAAAIDRWVSWPAKTRLAA